MICAVAVIDFKFIIASLPFFVPSVPWLKGFYMWYVIIVLHECNVYYSDRE